MPRMGVLGLFFFIKQMTLVNRKTLLGYLRVITSLHFCKNVSVRFSSV